LPRAKQTEDAADRRLRLESPRRRLERAQPRLRLDELLARVRPGGHGRILTPWTRWWQPAQSVGGAHFVRLHGRHGFQ
jgi:hypothetical protein